MTADCRQCELDAVSGCFRKYKITWSGQEGCLTVPLAQIEKWDLESCIAGVRCSCGKAQQQCLDHFDHNSNQQQTLGTSTLVKQLRTVHHQQGA